ncbi:MULTISPECIES: hypothetical protein [Methylocystis]|uniref:hypothetical protein n=1 Tax=Methylocystis TaxID=133 RepID=UPI001921B13D|nr:MULTISPECIES: hypothetical protein [Methylocystis]MBL1258735.1 hypothetical protein [Methylocystis sp. Sn-Cys]
MNVLLRIRTYFPCSPRKRSSADRFDRPAIATGVSVSEAPALWQPDERLLGWKDALTGYGRG